MLSGGLVLAGSLTHSKYLSMFDAVGKPQEYRPHVVVQPKQAEKPEEVKVEQAKSDAPRVVSSGSTSTPAATVTSNQPVEQPKATPVYKVKSETKYDLLVEPGKYQAQQYDYYSDGSVIVTKLPAYTSTTSHVVNTGN